ncbi:MAG: flavin reductase [Clostridiales bacterium]|jgi:flavin reductase (DIM6/NTAB) family NADH-FMN oxidoreductase RutF|nr:flavin reductase [Clostridiales bacterium]
MITQKHITILEKALHEQGLFVTCGKNPPNLMSTHWGSIGYFFNRWVFILPVRQNKLSHEIIDQTGEFTVSVPYTDLRNAIMKADIISGRKVDKFIELHLHPVKAKQVNSFVVGDCGLHLECKVIYTSEITRAVLNDAIFDELYSKKDYHTMYFAEIIMVWEK